MASPDTFLRFFWRWRGAAAPTRKPAPDWAAAWRPVSINQSFFIHQKSRLNILVFRFHRPQQRPAYVAMPRIRGCRYLHFLNPATHIFVNFAASVHILIPKQPTVLSQSQSLHPRLITNKPALFRHQQITGEANAWNAQKWGTVSVATA